MGYEDERLLEEIRATFSQLPDKTQEIVSHRARDRMRTSWYKRNNGIPVNWIYEKDLYMTREIGKVMGMYPGHDFIHNAVDFDWRGLPVVYKGVALQGTRRKFQDMVDNFGEVFGTKVREKIAGLLENPLFREHYGIESPTSLDYGWTMDHVLKNWGIYLKDAMNQVYAEVKRPADSDTPFKGDVDDEGMREFLVIKSLAGEGWASSVRQRTEDLIENPVFRRHYLSLHPDDKDFGYALNHIAKNWGIYSRQS